MIAYILRRLLAMIPLLFLVSVFTFIIIQLPPGDFFDTMQAEIATSGSSQDAADFPGVAHALWPGSAGLRPVLALGPGMAGGRLRLVHGLERAGAAAGDESTRLHDDSGRLRPDHHGHLRHSRGRLFGHPPVFIRRQFFVLFRVSGPLSSRFCVGALLDVLRGADIAHRRGRRHVVRICRPAHELGQAA